MKDCIERAEQLFLNTDKVCKIRKNKRQVEHTFLAFYRANIFHHRLSYKSFFSRELVQAWELYLSEIQTALAFLGEHEKKFLESCYNNRVSNKNSFIFSRANYYCCLNKYSDKFLDLFDYEFFYCNISQMKQISDVLLIPAMNSQTNGINT